MKKLLFNLPLIFVTLAILFFSNMSAPPKVLQFNLWDKVQHSIAFFLFGIGLQLHFFSTKSVPKLKYVVLYTFVIGSLFGASDEFHQYFIPNRFVDFADWVADICGVIISLFFVKFVNQFVTNFLKDIE